MRIWKHIEYVWDASRGEYVIDLAASRWVDYAGPVAECKKNSSAPAPDPNIGKAAKENVQLGKDYLAFMKEQYAVGNERQGELDDLTKQVMGTQIEGMQASNERSNALWDRYNNLFAPVEDRMVKEANEYDSPEKQAEAAAAAKADVEQSLTQQAQQRGRQMAAMGIDPRSGVYAGIEKKADMDAALAKAGAQNAARERVKAQGMALREGAVNVGRGATSTAAQQQSLALTSGNSAVGNGMANEGNFRANVGLMGQGYQGAMGANSSAASMYQGMDSTRLGAYQAESQERAALYGGIGQMAGAATSALMMASSKDVKENKKPVKGALIALNGLNVEKWDYKDGAGDGGSHVGPYAEDFQRETGMGDGKHINMIDAMGLTMKAIQELDQKVDKLAGKANKKEAA